VRIDTNFNYESPAIKDGSQATIILEMGTLSFTFVFDFICQVRPAPMDLVLTATVSGLQNGVHYTMYQYDDETKVPTSKFNARRDLSSTYYGFTGSRYIVLDYCMNTCNFFVLI
jgi:hypothetical protein